jgi:hypothetical protein
MVELLHLGDQPRPKLVRNWQNGGVILLVKIRRSAPVYGWFTERFDTPVLKGAKALLDELHSDNEFRNGLLVQELSVRYLEAPG